jgi:hypothetical protein
MASICRSKVITRTSYVSVSKVTFMFNGFHDYNVLTFWNLSGDCGMDFLSNLLFSPFLTY